MSWLGSEPLPSFVLRVGGEGGDFGRSKKPPLPCNTRRLSRHVFASFLRRSACMSQGVVRGTGPFGAACGVPDFPITMLLGFAAGAIPGSVEECSRVSGVVASELLSNPELRSGFPPERSPNILL